MAWSNLMPWSSDPAKPAKYGMWHPIRIRLAKDSWGGNDHVLMPKFFLPRNYDSSGQEDHVLIPMVFTTARDIAGGKDHIPSPKLWLPRLYDSGGGSMRLKWGVYGGWDPAGGNDYTLPPALFSPRNYDDGGGSDYSLPPHPLFSKNLDQAGGSDYLLPPSLFSPKNLDGGAGNDRPINLKPAPAPWVDKGAGSDVVFVSHADLQNVPSSAGGSDYIWMTADPDFDLQIRTNGRDNAGGNDYARVIDLSPGWSRDNAGGSMRLRWGVKGSDEGGGTDKCVNVPRPTCRDNAGGMDHALLVEAIYVSARDLGYGTDLNSTARWLDRWNGSRSALGGDASDWEWNLNWTVIGNTTGTVNFSISHSWGSSALQWVSVQRRLRLTKNGTQIGSYVSQNHTTGGWSTTSTWNGISVAAGDVIRIEHWAESPYPSCRTCTVSAASMDIASL